MPEREQRHQHPQQLSPEGSRVVPLPLPNLKPEDRKTLMDIKVVASQYLDRQGREGLPANELWKRFWANIVDIIIEGILKEKVAIKRYIIHPERQTLLAEGYKETVAQLVQNTQDAQHDFFGEVPTRTAADNATWLELNRWAVAAQVGEAKLWSSAPDTPAQAYPGSTSAENHHAQEEFFSFFWLYVKVSETQVVCYQFRAWPNVAQMAEIQKKLGAPVPAGSDRLQERLVRNLISLSPEILQKYPDYATYVEEIIYEDQDQWFDRPEDLTDQQRLRFWTEVKTLFDTVFMPNALTVLLNLPDFGPFLEQYRQSQEYLQKVEELSSTFTVFYSALISWFTLYKEKGEKTYSFTHKKPKKALTEMMKLQFAKATGQELTPQQQKRERKIFNNFFSLAGSATSLFHCISLTPFSLAYKMAMMQGGVSALEFESLILRDHVAFHGYYIPREKGWQFIAAAPEPFKCLKCEGKKNCEVIGPCKICAECDSRTVKISEFRNSAKLAQNLQQLDAAQTAPPETPAVAKIIPFSPPPPELEVRVSPEALFNGQLEAVRDILAA